MDSLMIEALAAELNDRLSGARFEKIHQPEADTLIIKLWNGRETLHLLVSCSPRSARLHLTEQKFPNPSAPPRFCQLLRSRLKRLVSLRRIPAERVIEIECRGAEGVSYRLMVELMGRHANLVLVDAQGIIVDLLERREASVGGRVLLPGKPYLLPPPRTLQPLESWDGALPEELEDPEGVTRFLFRTLTPLSWITARDLAEGWKQGENLATLVQTLSEALSRQSFNSIVGFFEDNPVLSAFAPDFVDLEKLRHFDTVSQALEAYYRILIEESGELGEQQSLRRLVIRHQKKVRGRLEKIKQQEQGLGDADSYREYGELLLANLHRMRRGEKQIVVENYYQDPPQKVTIELDPQRDPHENAEAFFRKYKKLRRGTEHVERRLRETQEELEWIDGVAFALSQAREPHDITEIRTELEEAGMIASAGRMRKSVSRDRRSKPHSAVTPGGFTLYWGKNSRTNDDVSRELATAGDLWFHAHRIPGSHLILKARKKGEEIPEADLLYAAAVAAGHSRAADSGKVEVMVARAEDVRKPKGARPGLVTVNNYHTVMVKPLKAVS